MTVVGSQSFCSCWALGIGKNGSAGAFSFSRSSLKHQVGDGGGFVARAPRSVFGLVGLCVACVAHSAGSLMVLLAVLVLGVGRPFDGTCQLS